jgi:signal transduction histidine kinase/CheY-like chemotaxis protein
VEIEIGPDSGTALSSEITDKWQEILNVLARTAKIPAALLMRVHREEIEVFAASENPDNVYRKGATEHLGCGLYCETVVGRREGLLVPDATRDPLWTDNPDVPLGMISYYGEPVTWPDGSIFGTLCILDRKENAYNEDIFDLVAALRGSIEADLSLQVSQARLEEADRINRAFLEGSRAVFECDSFETAARRIFDACGRATGAVSGYVALLSRNGTENEVLFLESGGLPCAVDPSLPMPIRGLRADAYAAGEAVYENDFANSEHARHLPAEHVPMENVLFAPLMLNGKPEGLLGLANKPGGFTDQDAHLATEFANMAAIALRRNREAELMRARMETIRGINRMTTTSTASGELIERFIESMQANQQVEFAWAFLVDEGGNLASSDDVALTGDGFCEESYLREGKLPPCVRKLRESGLSELEFEGPFDPSSCEETGVPDNFRRICFSLSHQDDAVFGYFGLAFKAPNQRMEEEKRIYREIANDLSLALHGIEIKRQREETLAALREAKIAAEEASLAKSDFIAVMSHELRTPLNPVIGLSDLLMERSEEPETRHCAEIINSSGKHQLTLINDILDFCKIDKAQFKVDRQLTLIRPILTNVRDLLKDKVDRKRTRINLVLSREAPEELETDPVRLKQILMNLVGNAAKFTEEGFITISYSCEDGRCRIAVEDTGVGISEADQKTIFEPFAQAESKETRKYGGSGLGLAISRKLANLLGGELTLTSQLGEGSCFTLSLPVKAEVTAAEEPSAEEAAPAKRSVLIIEDDPSSAKTLFYLLKRYGFDLTVVHDGAAAIEATRDRDYDIILLDIQLPDINGKEVCRTIRKERGDQPHIIAQTALVLHNERENCLDAGVDAFVEKPIFAETLFSEIDEALSRLESASGQ